MILGLTLATLAWGWTPIAPGVEQTQWMASGPNRVSALRVNLCTPALRMRATTSAERGKKTSTWASSVGAVAAVNGGFFLSGYAPDGAAAGAGGLWPDAHDPTWRGWMGFGVRALHHMPSGDSLWPPPWWTQEVVNGDATLVWDGQAVNCGGCGGGRNPRTAVGYTADRRTVYLVTVDGRSASSVGMTIDELAQLMASLGVDRAMNMDGGGSSTLWTTASGVMNVPSDGYERTVANHLGVLSPGGAGFQHHCPTGWAAQYVGSDFPGGTTIIAETGTTVTGTLSFRNDGTETWNGWTRMAPLPRDVPSPLAEGWIAGHRITAVNADTPPGGVGTFTFSMRAPAVAGETLMPFSILQEGVSWFGDSWGPEDGMFWMKLIAVDPPAWRAEVVSVDGLPDAGAWTVAPGATVAGSVTLKNTGTETWPSGIIRLGTNEPRDHFSPFAGPEWLGPNRPSFTGAAVGPGGTVSLPLTLHAPLVEGHYEDAFGLVAEFVTWFGDAGGPADGFLHVALDVEEPDPDGDGLDTATELDLGTDPHLADTDGDGLDDGEESAFGADPTLFDTDGDTLGDGEEVTLYGTDPAVSEGFAVVVPMVWTAGETEAVRVVGAPLGARVRLFASTAAGATHVPGCPGLFAPLATPARLGGVTAGSDGTGSLDVDAPPGIAGQSVWLVGVDQDACAVSAVAVTSIVAP